MAVLKLCTDVMLLISLGTSFHNFGAATSSLITFKIGECVMLTVPLYETTISQTLQ